MFSLVADSFATLEGRSWRDMLSSFLSLQTFSDLVVDGVYLCCDGYNAGDGGT